MLGVPRHARRGEQNSKRPGGTASPPPGTAAQPAASDQAGPSGQLGQRLHSQQGGAGGLTLRRGPVSYTHLRAHET
eukprot:9442095-Lingulodinium_polyedra.AAC.1